MRKLKLTINELKRQKEELRRYQRFLPALMLKKQNIQIELNRVRRQLANVSDQLRQCLEETDDWIAVMGEDAGIGELIEIEAVDTEPANVAGVDIPLFKGVRFVEKSYDLYSAPLWFDRALIEIKSIIRLRYEMETLQEQANRLEEELRIATQRVNLFEKVKIPKTRENIRVIQVFLGDQQTAAVVRGKIAKNKLKGPPTTLSPQRPAGHAG